MPSASDVVAKMFDRRSLIEICEKEFVSLKDRISDNIRNKKSNSGKDLNVFLQPAATTGETENSMSTLVEDSGNGFSVSFVGASHIGALDKGKSPEEVHQEFSSREEFSAAMEAWFKHKYERYGTRPKRRGMDVWEFGTTLYQQGGGTETVHDEVEASMERINEQITAELDNSLYELLKTTVNL